jgi:hypothetical protein
MAIVSILSQPAANALRAAYRPIVFRLTAVATDSSPVPPVVYCDIYFNGVYYKSISKTHYSKINSTNTEWEFDIQNAAQEYLSKFPGADGGSTILNASPVIALAQVKFRSSGTDASGFIQYEGTKPIQGTGDVPPVPGTGTASNTFFAVNASLQQEDNQDLATHLNFRKAGTWNSSYFPLTHRPNPYVIGRKDSDYFPIIDKNFGANIAKLALNYKLSGQVTNRRIVLPFTAIGHCLYLPSGPKNLQPTFAVNFSDIGSYFLEVLDSSDTVLATTVTFKINPLYNADDDFRIHFQNYTGTIDGITFKLVTLEHETKSDSFETPLRSPLDRSQHGVNRFNIKSNDTFQATCTDYSEADTEWIDELFDTPNAWVERKGLQGQQDQLIPIVVLDKKITKQKEDERFINEVTIDFKYSNAKILIRN